MGVERLWVRHYRSLLDVSVPLDGLTVVQGENAAGKTNLYRALLLLSRSAAGRLAPTVLEEGGMPSMRWAGAPPATGKRTRPPVRVTFGVTVDGVSYALDLGLPQVDPTTTPFALDAELKEEQAWIGKKTRHSLLLDRSGTTATATDVDGAPVTLPAVLDRAETALSQLGDPGRFPELFALRTRFAGWRFYHHFPTGPDAPSRRAQTGVRTPVLADDGRDLAAALATIVDAGRGDVLDEAIDAGFPGASLIVDASAGEFVTLLRLPGLQRPLAAHELSDGTLRYLCLAAALLSPRPPELLVLNEPETSLHPEVLGPLAGLIAVAAAETQVVVTTHAERLAEALAGRHDASVIRLGRDAEGRTQTASVD